jgi:hypothetical protein
VSSAKALAGHDDVRGRDVHERLHDQRPAHDRVGPVLVEARHRPAPADGPVAQPVRDARRPSARQGVSVQPGKRVGVEVAVDSGEVPDGAAGADQGIVPPQRREADVVERPVRVRAERLHLDVVGRIVLEELVAQQERPQGEAPRLDRASLLEPCDLEAPATDVEDDSGRDGEAVHGPPEGEPGLFFARDDADGHAGLGPDALEQHLRVGGFAHGGRGHGHHAIGPGTPCDRHEVGHDHGRPVDRHRAELRAPLDVEREAKRRPAVGEHVEVVQGSHFEDGDSARVGTHVDDRDALLGQLGGAACPYAAHEKTLQRPRTTPTPRARSPDTRLPASTSPTRRRARGRAR